MKNIQSLQHDPSETIEAVEFNPTSNSSTNYNTRHRPPCYMNNANEIAPYFIDDSLSTKKDEEMQLLFRNQVFQVLYEILPPSFWDIQDTTSSSSGGGDNSISSAGLIDQILIKPLSGGLSNYLFTVTNKETNKVVLVRIHPTAQEEQKEEQSSQSSSSPSPALINREYENQIVAFLSKHNIGPQFYGRFQNGRLEEFYGNHKPLSYNEMAIPKYAKGVATQMSNLHSLPLDGLMTINAKIGEDRAKEEHGENNCTTNYDEIRQNGDVWERIDNWILLAKQTLTMSTSSSSSATTSSTSVSSNDLAILHSLLQTIENEWKWYKTQMKTNNDDSNDDDNTCPPTGTILTQFDIIAMDFCREVVFTHMDCQSLNILTPDDTMISPQGSSHPTIIDGTMKEISSSLMSDISISPSSLHRSSTNEYFVTKASSLIEPVDNLTNSASSSMTATTTTSTTTATSKQQQNIQEQKESGVGDYHEEDEVAHIRLIDFEYAGYNRRVVDIANTFLEHCDMNNLKPNYELEYPSEEEQNIFIEEYLNQSWVNNYKKLRQGQVIESHNTSNGCNGASETNGKMLNKNDVKSSLLVDRLVTYMPSITSSPSCKNADGIRMRKSEWKLILNVIRKEILKHTLISHLEWATWAIIQINNNIDFDYIKYASIRMDGYFYFKNKGFEVE